MKTHSAPPPITIEQIAARAREIWERKGAPPGRDLEYWLEAENELVFEREQAAHAREQPEHAQGTAQRSPRPGGGAQSSKGNAGA